MPPPSERSVPWQQPGPGPAELRVRFNPVVGWLMVALGLAMLALGVASQRWTSLVLGFVLAALGVLYVRGTSTTITPAEVVVRSPAQMVINRVPIHGLQDLYLDGTRLHRRGDGKRIVSLGWGSAHQGDLAALRAAVGPAPERR